MTTQTVASSASGVLTYWRRGAIDIKMALILLSAGIVGSAVGAWLFDILQSLGQLDVVIAISYVTFLGTVGGLMLVESLRAIRQRRAGTVRTARRPGQHNWIHGLPLKVRFRKSKLYLSVIPVIVLGAGIGFIGTVLGIGGGFMMVPAMIYLLRMPTSIVIGTSLMQILFTMASATLFHSMSTQTIDIVLALTLMIGGVIGAQFGARMGQKLRGDQLRLLLALLVLAVGVRFAVDLVITPTEYYSVAVRKGRACDAFAVPSSCSCICAGGSLTAFCCARRGAGDGPVGRHGQHCFEFHWGQDRCLRSGGIAVRRFCT